jgi:hypothetical protein
MEPLLLVLIPGVFGGLVLSWLIGRHQSTTPPTFVPRRLEAPSPSLINMSSIKVEGLGGLGMVAAVIAVAIADSRIRLAMIIALVLGGGLALGLIAMRRRDAESGRHGGPDDSILHIYGSGAGNSRSPVTSVTPDSPHKPEDTRRRARRVRVSRVFSLVSVRHRCPVGVNCPAVIEALLPFSGAR